MEVKVKIEDHKNKNIYYLKSEDTHNEVNIIETIDEKVEKLEVITTAIITVLNEKGITP